MTRDFYMWEKRRENLIAEHKFLVSEGKKRLTDQFARKDVLKKEADQFSKSWLERVGKHFDPGRHDPGDFYEQAEEEGVDFYFALDELGNSARLALISCMFHLWERSLREWLTSQDGIGAWHSGDALPKEIWKSNFPQIFELIECVGLFSNNGTTKGTLDTCRLVVNTYKHGKGPSLEQLKSKRPELLDQYGWRSHSQLNFYIESADHTDLYVGSELIDEFSDAIVAFWKEISKHSTEVELQTLPKWFRNAYQKDTGGTGNAN